MDIITTHLNADFDALAAMVAAKKLYPQAAMVFPGSQERNVREYIKQAELGLTFPRLKTIDLAEVTRLIVVDTRQRSRIGAFAECLANPGLTVHLYDHHPQAPDDLSGELEMVRSVGSTTTLLVKIFQERGLTVTREEATLLMVAIHEDTGSFLFDTTTPEDLEAAAWLLAQQANLNMVSAFIVQELDAKQLSIVSTLIDSAITYTIQGMVVVVTRITLPDYIDEFALLVRKFMVIENLDTLFALATMGDRLYLIARSRVPEVNVGSIALEFGGGGHASAASATVRDMSLIEAEEKLVALLHRYIRPRSLARELMSAPVISVPLSTTLAEANAILTRYNLTVLPVLDAEERVLGLISRRVTEKSIFHGMGELPAAEYMNTDFATVPPEATLSDIQERIIEHRQRFIPVVEGEHVIGVITRTDLLNLLVKDQASANGDPTGGEEHPSSVRHRNVSQVMANSLPKEMIVLLKTIGEIASELGLTAFAVGGFVRDLLRHSKNFDLDIVIEGDGIRFAGELAARLGGVARPHEKFHTAVVKLPDGFIIDVASARLEYYAYPAALPTVEMSSIKLDLFRRDFTINALAIALNPQKFGLLIDFFNCQNDIRDQQIRVLHNLSFVEDPTRIFRAIRFEQRLGFKLGKFTERLIKSAIRQEMFGRFSGKRFLRELTYILNEENPQPALYRLAGFNLLAFFHPALKLDQRQKTILRETHRGVAWYRLLYRKAPFCQWQTFVLALTFGLSPQQFLDFCQKFEVSEREQNEFLRQKVAVMKIIQVMARRLAGDKTEASPGEAALRNFPAGSGQASPPGSPLRPSEIYWLLKGLSTEGLLYLMGVVGSKAGKQAVSLYVTDLSRVTPALHGAELKEMGYPAGPLYTTILHHLLEGKLDGLLVSVEDERAFLRQHYPLPKDEGGEGA